MEYIFIVLFGLVSIRLAYNAVNILQINGYKLKNTVKDIRKYTLYSLIGVVFAALQFILPDVIVYSAFLAATIAYIFIFQKRFKKAPLVFTNRVKRLFAVYIPVYLVILYLLRHYQVLALSFYYVVLLAVASVVNVFESLNNRRYVCRAKRFFRENKSLLSIGITGSYGKTGVKNILYEMLRRDFKTVKTEASYNTPLGMARAVKNIKEDTQVFIAEMGARRKGNIKELCEIVRPQYAILTGIAEQHMETFKSVENIISTKTELYRYVKEAGGVCVFNTDNAILEGLAEEYGYANIITNIQVYGVTVDENGSRFKMPINGVEYEMSTELLGVANISNIAAAAALAVHLGVGGEAIAEAVRELKPVPHRLQLLKSGGLTVIDDTYNSNPVGAAAALNTLKLFNGRKIVVACGFAEAGSRLEELNAEFGRSIAEVVDMAVLIGRNADSIKRGLAEKGFTNTVRYATLNDAKKDFHILFRNGDVVLMENDMPDNME